MPYNVSVHGMRYPRIIMKPPLGGRNQNLAHLFSCYDAIVNYGGRSLQESLQVEETKLIYVGAPS